MEKVKLTRKTKSRRPTYSSGQQSLRGPYSPKQFSLEFSITTLRCKKFSVIAEGRGKVPLCMARNVELLHECFPKHLRMKIARLKSDKDTEEEGNKRKGYMED